MRIRFTKSELIHLCHMFNLTAYKFTMNLMACLDGGGEGGGVEESRVELTKNKLILC